ncbi:MAG: hypothetical protein ACREP9_15670 [Candidatus Dormibacteraceae bacterium]
MNATTKPEGASGAIDGKPGPMKDGGFDSNDKEYWNKQVDGMLSVK